MVKEILHNNFKLEKNTLNLYNSLTLPSPHLNALFWLKSGSDVSNAC